MIWTLLVGVALATTPDEQELMDALLLPPEPQAEVVPTPHRPQVPWWPVPAGLLGMGLLWVARQKVLGGFGASKGHSMQVHSRIQLGQGSGLAVVEIETPDGPRRLLMGVGSGVPPRLVADLDDRFRDDLIDELLDRGQR